MSMLKMIFYTESALLFRNKFLAIPLIINVLFWGYMVVFYEIQDVHTQERAAVFYNGFTWILLFNLLIVGLFAVYMTGKDRESEFENLVITYQVKNTEWIMGKWLVGQLYGGCITFIALLVQFCWFMSSQMSFADVVKNLFYVFIQMEGAFFLVISLGFLFGVLMKNTFAYIFIPAILVLSLGLPFDYVGVAETYDNPRFHLLTPFDYMFMHSPYETIWGIDRVFKSAFLHQIIVFLFGLVFILVTLWLFRPNRRMKREKNTVPILIVVLIIPTLLLSGTRYAQYNQALEQFITTGKQYIEEWEVEDFYDTSLDYQKYDFSMEATDLLVQLQPNHQLDVTSHLTIKHNGREPTQEVKLTLFHSLQVTECSSESKVTCTREKDFVTVHFDKMIEPGEQFNLNLNYHGSILQYRDEGFLEHSFIGENRVYLPKEAGWYPLIGERQLIVAQDHNNRYLQFEQRNGSLVEDFPTAFTVKVMNENREVPLALTIPEIEAGMYQGTTQYGLSLVGGHLVETTVDEIRIVSHPEVQVAVKERVERYRQVVGFIEEWLEIPLVPSVIYVLNDEHYYFTYSREFLVWHPLFVEDKSDSTLAYEIVEQLTNGYITWGEDDFNMVKVAIRWIVENNYQDKSGFKDWYLSTWGQVEDTKLLETLHEYEEKGEDEFKDIVKFLYLQYSQLEDKSDFDAEATVQLYERETSL